MHISDGVLPVQTWAVGYAVAGAAVAYVLAKKMEIADVPKVAVVTAAVFVASLIHVPVGPTCVHFMLSGLAGILLGWRAVPSIFIALLLQALLFQHGGLTTVGVNTITIGFPALAGFAVFRFGTRLQLNGKHMLFGGLAGAVTVALSTLLLFVVLLTMGEDPGWMLTYVVIPHVAIMAIEAVVSGAFAQFVSRVKPEILQGSRPKEVSG
jgi:cobalt/nickel transport system permease protein